MAATSMTAGEFSPMPTFSFLRQLYGETEFSSAVVRDDHDWQLPGSQSYHSKIHDHANLVPNGPWQRPAKNQ